MTRFADLMCSRVTTARYCLLAGVIIFFITGGPFYTLLSPPLALPATGEIVGYRWYDAPQAAGPVEVTVFAFSDASGATREIERVGHFVASVPLRFSRLQSVVVDLDSAPASPGQFVFLIGVGLALTGAGLSLNARWRMHRYQSNLRRVLRH
ncbi:MAG: hypothetical protein HZB53_15090 [Chloroflexi bacterium]|nr:hypothetical protein [Chloroflexota bacterium]